MANFRAKLIENLSFNNSFTQIKTDELLRLDKIIAEIAIANGLQVEEIRVARYLKTSGQQKELIDKLRESVIIIKK